MVNRERLNKWNILCNTVACPSYWLVHDTYLSFYKKIKNVYLSNLSLCTNIKYQLKTMDLYTSNALDMFPFDEDILIICDSHIELFFKKKKLILRTYGYWNADKYFAINWCSSYIHILNNELDTILYLRSYVVDLFNDNIHNTYYCEIIQKDTTYIADIYLAPRKKVDSIVLLKKPTDVLTIARIKNDTFLIQYFSDDDSNNHLTIFFKDQDVINTIYYLPIFRVRFIYNYRFTLIFTRGCLMILDEENIQKLIDGEPELAIMVYYCAIVEPIITKDELFLICIEREHEDLFLTCIQLYSKFDSIKRKLPKLNYTFLDYNDKTNIINIGTDIGGVVEFNLFDDGHYEK